MFSMVKKTQLLLPNDADAGAPVRLDTSGLTDVGRVRRRNEDQFLIATMQQTMTVHDTSVSYDALRWLPGGTKGTLLLVADGMGGVGDGDVASAVAVRSIASYLCNVMPIAAAQHSVQEKQSLVRGATLPGVRQGLRDAISEGDEEVRRAAKAGLSDRMGTTLTMAYINWPQMYVAHVGDSRAYMLRKDLLVQLTKDHTLAAKLMEETKIMVADDSPWHHMLWNALGGGDDATTVEPEVRRCKLKQGDVVLLCSDGLTKHVSDDEIVQVLKEELDATSVCERLVAMANAAGGTDNITVAVARCEAAPSDSEAAPTVRR
jgi:serine/threonine protein phosphatase PrpC